MIRMVLEGGHVLGARHLAKTQPLLPSRMPSHFDIVDLFVQIIGIIDYQIAILDQRQYIFIWSMR